MWFQQPDAFTLVQFRLECGPDHLLKWFERSDLNASQKCFGGHLHLVFSGSDSYPIRTKRMKWPGVNSPKESLVPESNHTECIWLIKKNQIPRAFCHLLHQTTQLNKKVSCRYLAVHRLFISSHSIWTANMVQISILFKWVYRMVLKVIVFLKITSSSCQEYNVNKYVFA